MILPIGHWVLHQAIAEAARWPAHISLAINISPLQVRSGGLLETIKTALASAGFPASRLEIEITETIMLDATTEVIDELRAIKDLGIRIAMDDFGTGYSSLHYVSSFPFDKLKIDRSFVSGLPNGSSDLAVLRAIASLGANLGMITTAEGVETREQLAIVRDEGCTEVQGFYFARPAPATDIETVIDHCSDRLEAFRARPSALEQIRS